MPVYDASKTLSTRALQELVASQLHRVDRVWAQSRLVDPQAAVWADLEAATSRTAAEELLAVLDWACDRRVIDGQERSLLLSLVAAAADADVRHLGRGRAGLLANSISETVAEECGVSPITVRRRARRAVQALATAFANHHVAA